MATHNPGARISERLSPQAFAALERLCFEKPWGADSFAPGNTWLYFSYWTGPSCIAYAAVALVADEMELLRIAVHPDQRRKGYAARLLAAIARRGKALDVRSLFLEVSDTNQEAKAFYTAQGWKLVGRRRGYYGPGEDALLMRLNLTP